MQRLHLWQAVATFFVWAAVTCTATGLAVFSAPYTQYRSAFAADVPVAGVLSRAEVLGCAPNDLNPLCRNAL